MYEAYNGKGVTLYTSTKLCCLAVKFHLANGSRAHLFSFNVIHACAVIVCLVPHVAYYRPRAAAQHGGGAAVAWARAGDENVERTL